MFSFVLYFGTKHFGTKNFKMIILRRTFKNMFIYKNCCLLILLQNVLIFTVIVLKNKRKNIQLKNYF